VLWAVSRNSLGSEFHRFGRATENARRPYVAPSSSLKTNDKFEMRRNLMGTVGSICGFLKTDFTMACCWADGNKPEWAEAREHVRSWVPEHGSSISIETRLQWRTYRKWHIANPMVTCGMTIPAPWMLKVKTTICLGLISKTARNSRLKRCTYRKWFPGYQVRTCPMTLHDRPYDQRNGPLAAWCRLGTATAFSGTFSTRGVQ